VPKVPLDLPEQLAQVVLQVPPVLVILLVQQDHKALLDLQDFKVLLVRKEGKVLKAMLAQQAHKDLLAQLVLIVM
jgi:hypothetical protein